MRKPQKLSVEKLPIGVLEDGLNRAEETIRALHALATQVMEMHRPDGSRAVIDGLGVLIISEAGVEHIDRAVDALKPILAYLFKQCAEARAARVKEEGAKPPILRASAKQNLQRLLDEAQIVDD